ncbi:hypothetical protein BH23GEM3_BH23GEM3_22400 [soil metagenome]
MVIRRFDVFLVNLDPTVGSEIQKMRPCVVISPDEMNRYIRTVIIAPMTTKGRPSRRGWSAASTARKARWCSIGSAR